jgi:cytochrome P450
MKSESRDIFDSALIEKILLDSTYSAEYPFRDTRVAIGKSMVDTDGGPHDLVKNMVSRFFNQESVENYSAEIEAIVKHSFDQVDENSEVDVLNDIAFPISMKTSFRVFGIKETYLSYIRPHLENIALFITGEKVAVDVAMLSRREIETFVQKQWRIPELSGPLSALYQAQTAGTLSLAFALHNATLLIVSHLDHEGSRVIQNNHSLLTRWISDLLRCHPPLTKISRFRKAQREDGNSAQSQECVNLFLACQGTGNALPGRSLSFGMGEHACLGSRLALRELTYVTRALANRIRPTSRVVVFEERGASLKIPKRMVYSW